MVRFYVPEVFADFDVLPEDDPEHPESDVRFDIPRKRIYINTAARPDANVIRVRFNDAWPKRRWWE